MLEKLIKKIETIMKNGQKIHSGLSLASFLYGVSIFYQACIMTRIHLYRARIFKSKKLPCFVISIGNICVGGTGKTPMTIYLSQFLSTLGYKVAIITRGYKGKLEQKGGIVSDGETIFFEPIDAGDEPFMMAKTLKLPVIAGKKRFSSGITAIKKFSADIIVLDDAFQHLALERNLDILLLDAKKPLGNGFLLPRGILREPVRSIRRCDAAIFTRSDCTNNIESNDPNVNLAGIPIFKSIHEPFIQQISVQKPNPKSDHKPDAHQPEKSEQYKGKKVILFSGIADNSAVKDSCKRLDLFVERHLEFADHHWYTSNDIDFIISSFKKSHADFIATTQKDFTRIFKDFPSKYPLIIFDVQIKFSTKDQIRFEQFVTTKINQYFEKPHAHRSDSVLSSLRD